MANFTTLQNITLRGPFWTARADIVQVSTPATHNAWRGLFVDLLPHTIEQPGVLVPNTLLAVCRVTTLRIQDPAGGPGFSWTQAAGAPPADLTPETIRQAVQSGTWSLLVLQADAAGWTGSPIVMTVLAGDIVLDGLQPQANARALLYQALQLAERPLAPDRSGAATLLGSLTAHASGLSVYGAVILPWEDAPVDAVMQLTLVASEDKPAQGMHLTLETDRLTPGETQALAHAWHRLARALNPAYPWDGLPSLVPAPRWATLEAATPDGVPHLIWTVADLQGAADPFPLSLASGELSLLLTDQPPYDTQHPPTSLGRLVPDTVTIQVAGAELSVTLAAGETPATAAVLTYHAAPLADDWQEAVSLAEIALAFSPVETPRRLRHDQAVPTPEWDTGDPPLAPPAVWAFMPLEEGWAQLPVPNLTEQIYLEAGVAATPPPDPLVQLATRRGIIQGAVSWANEQTAVGEQPWRFTVANAQSLRGTWTLQRPGDAWSLAQIDFTLARPLLYVNGLLWFSTGRPTVTDALPDLDDWAGGLWDVPLNSIDGDELFPPLLTCELRNFTVTPVQRVTGPVAAVCGPCTWELAADAELLDRFVQAGTLPDTLFGNEEAPVTQLARPVVWRRHPTVPMVQALPLTQALTPPNVPVASRELAPNELEVARSGELRLPQNWRFVLESAAVWPRFAGPSSPAGAWRVRSDLPLAALSLPGLLLRPQLEDAPLGLDAGSGLALQLRYDLPVTDELQALAQLPPTSQTAQAAEKRAEPPQPLDPTTLPAHWDRLAEQAALAAADDVDVFKLNGQLVVAHLAEPFSWPVSVQLDLAAYPGALTMDNVGGGAPLTLTGDDALRGLHGRFTTVDGGLQRLDDAAVPATPPLVAEGGSLAGHLANGRLRDQRGLARGSSTTAAVLVRTPVQQGDDPIADLVSLRIPCLLDVGGPAAWQLWLRDVPVRADVFTRSLTRSSRTVDANDPDVDANDPESLASDYDVWQGYEWRLGLGTDLVAFLPLWDLQFYPLTLEEVSLAADDLIRVVVTGRLQLPLAVAQEQTQLANTLRLIFEGGGMLLTLSGIEVDPASPVTWPLALAAGETGDAPQLSWQQAHIDAGTLVIDNPVLDFFLFDTEWHVALAPLVFPAAPGPMTHHFAPGANPLQPVRLELTLDTATGRHGAVMELAAALGQPGGRVALRAAVRFNLLAPDTDATWVSGTLFEHLTLEPNQATALVSEGTLQFQWRTASAAGDAAALLPGIGLDLREAPGCAVLTFATETTGDLPGLKLGTAFMETVLTASQGLPMQVADPNIGDVWVRTFGAAATELIVNYVGRWHNESWEDGFLLNGFMEIKNLISFPTAVTYDAAGGQLVLPAAQGAEPLDHLRHTVRILFNQHSLPSALLVPGDAATLFWLAPGLTWQPLAVVEHQLARVALADAGPQVQQDVRWTVTQELRLLSPVTLADFLQGQQGLRTISPSGQVTDLPEVTEGLFGQRVRSLLLAAGGLTALPSNMILVEATAHQWIRQVPLTPAPATTLQFLPSGSQGAVLSGPADYAPSDPLAPGWLLLSLPFLGRLQPAAADHLDPADPARDAVQVDPVLAIARQRTADPGAALSPLALALTNRGDAAVTIRVAADDDAVARTWSRLDPTALEEAWFRLHHQLAETIDEGVTLAGVTAALPDTPARAGRATALRQAFDPRRLAYPPVANAALLPEPNLEATPRWREDSLAVLENTTQTPPNLAAGWPTSVLQLMSSQLLPFVAGDAGLATVRYAAATLLPAQDRDQLAAYPAQSLAVSPYLGLVWRPAGGRVLKMILAELLCFDPARQQLRTIATHLQEVEPDAEDQARTRIEDWALAKHNQLASLSPVALVRTREVYDNPDPDSPDVAALSVRYGFALVTGLRHPARLARKRFALRAGLDRLRFREGQCGEFAMPTDVRDFELAPPQTIGVQPLWLLERPVVADGTGPVPRWGWGLSALCVSVRSTESGMGVIGTAGQANGGPPPTRTLWWQTIQQRIQYRSTRHSTLPAAGLPARFRAPAIRHLLPALPDPPLPTGNGTPFTNASWQAVLPGALRFLVVGSRPGVFLSLRHSLLRQSGLVTGGPGSGRGMSSGAIPVQVRLPRPVPLPANDPAWPAVALCPWVSAFEPDREALITRGPADEAYFAACGGRPAARMQMRLVAPFAGGMTLGYDGTLVFGVRTELGETLDGWEVQVEIGDGPQICAYALVGPAVTAGQFEWRPQRIDMLARLLAAKPPGSTVVVRARVKPLAHQDGYYQVLTFPLRLVDPSQPRLPLQPAFIHFEDPEYNRRLASTPARVRSQVQIEQNGRLVPFTLTWSADRRQANADTTLYLRWDWLDEPPESVVFGLPVLQRLGRDGIARPLAVPEGFIPEVMGLGPAVQAGRLVELSLPAVQAKGDLQFEAGDRLIVSLRVLLLTGMVVELTALPLRIDIVATPVQPAPEAAYALLRRRGDAVACVRFAWGPRPARVDLVCADDLRGDVVRRRAVFHLWDSARPLGLPGYAVQKVAASGSTFVPQRFVPPAE